MSGQHESTTDPRLRYSGESSGTNILNLMEWRESKSVGEEGDETVSASFASLSEQLGDISRGICERPIVWNGQLRDLGREDMRLLEPLLIVFEQYPDEESVAARYDEVGAYGEGVTESDAIQALRDDICVIYEDLSNSGLDNLGPFPASCLRILNQIILKD